MRVSLAKRSNNTNVSRGRKESNGDVVDTVKKPSGMKKQCIYCAEQGVLMEQVVVRGQGSMEQSVIKE